MNTLRHKPRRAYWICCTPRTGSALLCQLLRATGVAGRPEEYFWRDNEPLYRARWHVTTYHDYLERALEEGTTPNGIFGAKVGAGMYLAHFFRQLRTLPQFEDATPSLFSILSALFPDLKCIWLTRRNKVRQAVSYILRYLEVSDPYVLDTKALTLARQADSLSEAWVQQYRDEKQHHWPNRAW